MARWTIAIAAAVLLAGPASASGGEFALDVTEAEAIAAAGAFTVGDLRVAEEGRIAALPTDFCRTEANGLALPGSTELEPQVVDWQKEIDSGRSSWDTFFIVKRLPGGYVSLATERPERVTETARLRLVKRLSRLPACAELNRLYPIDPRSFLPVMSIDGDASLRQWLKAR